MEKAGFAEGLNGPAVTVPVVLVVLSAECAAGVGTPGRTGSGVGSGAGSGVGTPGRIGSGSGVGSGSGSGVGTPGRIGSGSGVGSGAGAGAGSGVGSTVSGVGTPDSVSVPLSCSRDLALSSAAEAPPQTRAATRQRVAMLVTLMSAAVLVVVGSCLDR